MCFDATFQDRSRKGAAVVIDLQEKMLPAVHGWEKVDRNTGVLIEACKVTAVPVKYTEHYPKGLGKTVPSVMEKLPVQAGRMEKIHFSCCMEEDLRISSGLEEGIRSLLPGWRAISVSLGL